MQVTGFGLRYMGVQDGASHQFCALVWVLMGFLVLAHLHSSKRACWHEVLCEIYDRPMGVSVLLSVSLGAF